jgi:hypothetical protein
MTKGAFSQADVIVQRMLDAEKPSGGLEPGRELLSGNLAQHVAADKRRLRVNFLHVLNLQSGELNVCGPGELAAAMRVALDVLLPG